MKFTYHKDPEGRINAIDCPKLHHVKQLVVCALNCPVKGGNAKCAAYLKVPDADIQRVVDEYQSRKKPEVTLMPSTTKTETTEEKKPTETPLYVYTLAGMARIVRADMLKTLPEEGAIYLLGSRVQREDIIGKAKKGKKPVPKDKGSDAEDAKPAGDKPAEAAAPTPKKRGPGRPRKDPSHAPAPAGPRAAIQEALKRFKTPKRG